MANELTPWQPGYITVVYMSGLPLNPYQPETLGMISIERISREAILRAAARSYWQYHAGRDNG